MIGLVICVVVYLVLAFITAKVYLRIEHRHLKYSDLPQYEQGGVLFCFWFWWLAWIITVSYYISKGLELYVQPLLGKLWDKLL